MENNDLRKSLATLESVNDQMEAELSHLDQMLRLVGFSNGLETFKAAATELISQQKRAREDKAA